MGGWTLQQKQLASILPHISGFLSWLGSIAIIVDVIRKYREHRGNEISNNSRRDKFTAYHRLMMGMSFCDLCASVAWMLSTWLVPADSKLPDGSDTFAAHGSDASCRAQAFFIQLGIGDPMYNLCLSIYYYLLIVKNSKPSVMVERCLHLICLGYALCTAISGLALNLYGYTIFWCWIKEEHKLERWLFWYGPLWGTIVAITVIMASIYWSLVKKEIWLVFQQGAGETPATAVPNIANDDGNVVLRRSSTREEAFSASDEVKIQAFLYVGSFFLTWIFLSVVRGLQATSKDDSIDSIPFWVLLVSVTLCPAQGLFNYLIYIRPRYNRHRKSYPEVGRLASFFHVNPLVATIKCCRKSSNPGEGNGSGVSVSNVRISPDQAGTTIYEDALEYEVPSKASQKDDVLYDDVWHTCQEDEWKDNPNSFTAGGDLSFEQRQSDHALSLISETQIAIHSRMVRLEQDANVAKQNAVNLMRNQMTQTALVHMRRRKTVMEELDRCSTLIATLDAQQMRLERAKNDLQIVQSLTALRLALQGIRSANGMKSCNVEDMMMDIREMVEDAAIYEETLFPEVFIDEDELDQEFRLLEIESESEQLDIVPTESKDLESQTSDVWYSCQEVGLEK